MIDKHPDVPDNFFVLDAHNTISDYARAYGDQIARRFEKHDIIYMPSFPLPVDLPFIHGLKLPEALAKIGVTNGIEKPVFIREGKDFKFDHDHMLYRIFRSETIAGYLQNQFLTCNQQIRLAIQALFPKYYSLTCHNITWRLTDTPQSLMHIDYFNDGKPIHFAHKIKIFINLDREPRRWRTSYIFPEILARYRDEISKGSLRDRNAIAWTIAEQDLLKDAPAHAVAFPPMSALIVNADVVSHQVLYGKRTVVGEFSCSYDDLLDPQTSVEARLPEWLSTYGYAPQTDVA